MAFLLGCNYWASNAGTEMWRQFDPDCIREDLKILAEHGVTHIRAFPNWRDFQPVSPQYTHGGGVYRYYTECESANNAYFLDKVMLDRFECFLDLCQQNGISVVVGLITGWMSGALFIPPALYGKNVLTDHAALYFEQLFIRGFIERFVHHQAVYAWDLGNECNCMGKVANRFEAVHWTATIANAIRAADPVRPIVSGMHGLGITTNWTIPDQALHTDVLTTHPYPYWCDHTHIDEMCSLRTTMHPTAQTKFYAEIGGKPCLAEELGTMGPMVCGEEKAADFLRINLFSLWANGATGAMWWCANEQTALTSFPYSDNMCEQELGMLDIHHRAKPVLREMKAFANWLRQNDVPLTPAQTQAVCITTNGQDQWGVAYMTHILSRQNGINCRFAYGDDALPEAPLYLLPSLRGLHIMPNHRFEALKQRVFDGADLYLSTDDAIIARFEEMAGVHIVDSYASPNSGTATLADGQTIAFSRVTHLRVTPTSAKVLAYDQQHNPFVTVNSYGKGRVIWVNAPIEQTLIQQHDAFGADIAALYCELFKDHIEALPVRTEDPALAITYHPAQDGATVVVCNHSEQERPLSLILANHQAIDTVYYGDASTVKAWDACVFQIR